MLEFYCVRDIKRENPLFVLSESSFLKLEEYFLSANVNIDLYGKTVLYEDQINRLIKILNNFNSRNSEDLIEFLLESLKKNIELVIEGN